MMNQSLAKSRSCILKIKSLIVCFVQVAHGVYNVYNWQLAMNNKQVRIKNMIHISEVCIDSLEMVHILTSDMIHDGFIITYSGRYLLRRMPRMEDSGVIMGE